MFQATDTESVFSVKGTVAAVTGGGSDLGANIALGLDVSMPFINHVYIHGNIARASFNNPCASSSDSVYIHV